MQTVGEGEEGLESQQLDSTLNEYELPTLML